MELLRFAKRKSLVNEVLYYGLNIGLAVAIVLTIQLTDSLILALLIFLVSKWRVFAIRPRYWFAHLQSNLVDYIVGISTIVLMFLAHSSVADEASKSAIMTFYTLAYIVWLVYIKPKSKRIFMHIQAGVALFLGTTALFSIAYDWSSAIVVFVMAIIGYATARHVLSSYEEMQITLISMMWAIVTAEFGWMVYHWTVAYKPLSVEIFAFPRAALTILCVGLIAERAYESLHKHDRIRFNDVLMPIIFTIAVTVVLPLLLSLLGPSVTIGI